MKAALRKARVEDIPALCLLLAQLFEQELEFTPDPERQAKALKLLLSLDAGSGEASKQGVIWVAELPEDTSARLIGMVSVLYVVSTALGGRAAWIEDMVIDDAWRGQGIGGALLEAAVADARAAGCLRLSLLTDNANLRGQSFYTAHGFEASSMLTFRKLLTD